MTRIESEIKQLLELERSYYFVGIKSNGETLKIRVSDHMSNKNNSRDEEIISLVSEKKYYGKEVATDEFIVSEYENRLYLDDMMKDLTSCFKMWGIVEVLINKERIKI
jgi:hypothetical protein